MQEVLVYRATALGSGGGRADADTPPFAPTRGGTGGHVGFGDRKAKVGFAYAMTEMFGSLTGDPRPAAVLDAPKKCLS